MRAIGHALCVPSVTPYNTGILPIALPVIELSFCGKLTKRVFPQNSSTTIIIF